MNGDSCCMLCTKHSQTIWPFASSFHSVSCCTRVNRLVCVGCLTFLILQSVLLLSLIVFRTLLFRFQLYNISHLAQLDILSWYEKNVWYADIDKIIRICKNLIMLLISNDRSKVI